MKQKEKLFKNSLGFEYKNVGVLQTPDLNKPNYFSKLQVAGTATD
jgi:hypothetical protein